MLKKKLLNVCGARGAGGIVLVQGQHPKIQEAEELQAWVPGSEAPPKLSPWLCHEVAFVALQEGPAGLRSGSSSSALFCVCTALSKCWALSFSLAIPVIWN